MKLDKLKTGALKHNEGKLRMDLVPPEAIESIASGMTYGSKKYGDRNWEKGIPFMTSYASALRHLLKWAKGNDVDEESGEHHVDAALTNLAMLATAIKRHRTDLDNRPSNNHHHEEV